MFAFILFDLIFQY